MCLPTYFPMLAQVELFFRMVKNRQREILYSKNVCFDKSKDRVIIYESIKDWTTDEIKYMGYNLSKMPNYQ